MTNEKLLETLKPTVDATIEKLAKNNFTVDPIAGPHFSKITSVLSSAYKRHGHIIEAAILARVNAYDRYEAHRVERFFITDQASGTVESAHEDFQSLKDAHLPYVDDPALKCIQIDMVLFDKERREVRAYEVKRANGQHDAGKKRSMRREALLAKVLLKNYGRTFGWEANASQSHVIFYYNKRGIPAPIGIIGDELDDHFGVPVRAFVESVNEYFRTRLFDVLSHA